ncbi:MAG: hypothetical protein LBG06_11775, partial [Deltaproteobacteria bacterium]|nr:hypothetical protein [Deltaproteobacteria bacterium]
PFGAWGGPGGGGAPGGRGPAPALGGGGAGRALDHGGGFRRGFCRPGGRDGPGGPAGRRTRRRVLYDTATPGVRCLVLGGIRSPVGPLNA